jgi:hypothetical protein
VGACAVAVEVIDVVKLLKKTPAVLAYLRGWDLLLKPLLRVVELR